MSTTIELTLDDRTTAALDSLKSSKGKNREDAIKSIILDYATLKGASLNSIDQHPKIANERLTLDTYGSFYFNYIPTQYHNPVMNVKVKITRFCNWLQSM
jgi:hypothetical protein